MPNFVKFLDLHTACTRLHARTVRERVAELDAKLGGVYVVAVGGFPIVREAPTDTLTWCGSPASVGRIRDEIRKGLGSSASLTFMNKANKTLTELGNLCLQRTHTWAYRWMTVSMLFVGYELPAELSFGRDGNFYMSWPVTEVPMGNAFVASANLSTWGFESGMQKTTGARLYLHLGAKEFDKG